MSLTPLDETDGHPGEDGNPAERGDSGGGVAGRLLGRVRSALGRLATALRRPLRSTETAVEAPPQRLPGIDGRDPTPPRPVEQSRRIVESEGVPQRSAPSAVFDSVDPDDGPPGDRPELVATWDEGGLTLSEPGDSDARISSDTWTEMER